MADSDLLSQENLAALQAQASASSKPKKAPMAKRRVSKKDLISNKRKEFAGGLFNEDLWSLAHWHKWRTAGEQKKGVTKTK